MKNNAFTLPHSCRSATVMAAMLLMLSACGGDNGSGVEIVDTDEPKAYVETQVIDSDGDIAIPDGCAGISGLGNKFSWTSFGELLANSRGEEANMIVSPFSLAVNLAMLNNGAVGDTRQEITATLGYGDFSTDDVNNYYAVLTRGLSQVDASVTFKHGNALWYNGGLQMKKAFLSILGSWYKAETQEADMAAEQTLADMNGWVDAQTNGLIKEMYGSIDEVPQVLALLNTLYVSAGWQTAFDKDFTRVDEFTAADGNVEEIPFMHGTYEMPYYNDGKIEAASVPLGDNGKFDMFFVLPTGGMSLSEAAEHAGSVWDKTCSEAKQTVVSIAMPRFSVSYTIGWKETLASMGCKALFDSTGAALLDGMADASGIYVDDIKQCASLNLDEAGVECAAATATGVVTGGRDESVSLSLSRPFLFGIKEKSTGVILFLGYVADPSAS